MKITKILSLLFFVTVFISCEENETSPELIQPTFTATVSPEDTGTFIFENTTPNKGDFYSYFEYDIAGDRGAADRPGTVAYSYKASGNKIVTLTMLGKGGYLQTSKAISVTVAPDPSAAFDGGLIVNGGLEDGSGDDFTSWNKNNGADLMTAETTSVKGGSRALKVTNTEDNAGDHWKTQFVSDAFDTAVGTTYVISFWIKGEAAVVRASTSPGSGSETYGGDMTATSDWTEYSQEFTATIASSTLSLDIGSTKGTFYIDNISVVAK